MPGWWLASGDQRQLTGSSSALEATMRYTNPQSTLLYRLVVLSEQVRLSVPIGIANSSHYH